MAQQSTNLHHALEYASQGFSIFRLLPGKKTPMLKNWQEKASNDPVTIKSWWSKSPNAGIAIHTGKSNLVILDIDPRNGGLESFETLKSVLGEAWLSAYKVISGGGGSHYYFSASGVNLASLRGLDLGPGIDVLHGNKYVIAPPSIHPSGESYKWVS